MDGEVNSTFVQTWLLTPDSILDDIAFFVCYTTHLWHKKNNLILTGTSWYDMYKTGFDHIIYKEWFDYITYKQVQEIDHIIYKEEVDHTRKRLTISYIKMELTLSKRRDIGNIGHIIYKECWPYHKEEIDHIVYKEVDPITKRLTTLYIKRLTLSQRIDWPHCI